nr:YgaP-like transmembrane domain [uncultured Campylobacter sp.]
MLSRKTRIIKALIGLAIMIAKAVVWQLVGGVGLVPFIVSVTGFCPACYFLNRCSLKR